MIQYKYPEEKTIAQHYAKKLADTNVEVILDTGMVRSAEDARTLSRFYWAMVDQAVQDQGAGIDVMEKEGFEHWLEYIFHTFNGYLVSNGYENEWDSASDN
ncbi:MAG TPA: hypothetical protein VLE50_07220 [Cellvibrio sp.]|nr:hypothetical protein [Cellvibrio sp.]